MTPTQNTESDPSLLVSAYYEVQVRHYERAVLSIPALHDEEAVLKTKNLLTEGKVSIEQKYTLDEHLNFLSRQNIIRPDRSLLVLGMRNSLVNLRAPVIWRGKIYAVEGEQPQQSVRPYYGVGSRAGKLVLDYALGTGHTPEEWPEFFCAGIPVLWDQLDDDALFDLMLAETVDHSHLFDLPRGKHPLATNETRAAWKRLQDVFVRHLCSNQQTVSQALRVELNQFKPPLRRCDNYLHAIIGSRPTGELVCLFAHGRLELLGQIAKQRGCGRAVCVENSGSIMPTLLPDGLGGKLIPLIRAPNFRAKGRAILVLELRDVKFESFTSCG